MCGAAVNARTAASTPVKTGEALMAASMPLKDVGPCRGRGRWGGCVQDDADKIGCRALGLQM